jgi:hypothetical protein
MNEIDWSKAEKNIARSAFEKAYERETSALIEDVREQAGTIATLEDIWRLHDFLSTRRHELDGKYDYRYSMLIFVFAQLVREGWLQPQDLAGLAPDKLSKVMALVRM